MSDVSELAPRLRYLSDRNAGTFIGDMFGEAADALETLAGEVERLRYICAGVYTGVMAYVEPVDSAGAAEVNRVADILLAAAEGTPLPDDADICPFHITTKADVMAPVVEAARDLMRSGYDGPFIGEVCEPLFSAMIALDAAHD